MFGLYCFFLILGSFAFPFLKAAEATSDFFFWWGDVGKPKKTEENL